MRWPAGSVRRMTLGRLTTRPALRARQLLADPVATAMLHAAAPAVTEEGTDPMTRSSRRTSRGQVVPLKRMADQALAERTG